MMSVGLKIMKNQLSKYVRLAEQGETIWICDRDKVVAMLSPPAPHMAPHLADALLAEAVRGGYVTAAVLPPGSPLAPRAATLPLKSILAELDEDRADR